MFLRSFLLILIMGWLTISVSCSRDDHHGATPAPVTANGTVDGGGGDSQAQQIEIYKKALLDHLTAHPMKDVETEKLRAAMSATKITLKEKLELNGQPVSAINYPNRVPPEIEFSRKDLGAPSFQRDRLVYLIFHEFLGILKIEASLHYPLSSNLNAAAIVHKVDLNAGRFVTSRLISVDMKSSKPGFYNPLDGEGAKYQCSHFGREKLHYSCGAAHVFTEKLVGVQLLKQSCPFTYTKKGVPNVSYTFDMDVEVHTSACMGSQGCSIMITISSERKKTDEILGEDQEESDELFREAVRSCKLKLLAFPDDSEDP